MLLTSLITVRVVNKTSGVFVYVFNFETTECVLDNKKKRKKKTGYIECQHLPEERTKIKKKKTKETRRQKKKDKKKARQKRGPTEIFQ